ncbi:polyprenol monophosphomannose synthase [Marinilongibacter aquaticus]|uniref:polyprenol monophosphomannose synthase n=1 Tax=Marinilongibacter aquaticus TaxID=2975157 RepID=UPI0021BDBED5|nr:polyprenol monophosphomannose synthase [Marinilongibacter aquaticus]UBM57573.1 polyprenol monophosphomannose synthase [Marinilongibacter aquaticus]
MRENLVIIPTYNEMENIRQIVAAVFELSVPFEILIVDDGSPDGTAEIVKELQSQHADKLHLIERQGKQGLGTAYIRGFKWALEKGYAFIYEMDADFSHNPKDLERLYASCKFESFDVAIGSRYIKGVNVVNWPIGRVLMSYFAGVYVRFITRMPIMDPTGGFICYSRKVLQAIDLDRITFVGYAFQIEMKFNAYLHKFKIQEVPIIFTDRTRGESKMSTKIFREAVLGVIFMKVWSWFKKYEHYN